MPKPKQELNLSLSGYDDIFASTVETAPANNGSSSITTDTNGERIIEIPLEELHPPEFHPFHVNDDEAMERLAANIKQYGVREPGLARPRADGGYELLAGNRRKRGCELVKLPKMPVIIREMDDSDATITMVDSNLEQRETLLYSEKAWAYRVKMEALNHNGVKAEMHSVEVLVAQTGVIPNDLLAIGELPCFSEGHGKTKLYLCRGFFGVPNCASDEISSPMWIDLSTDIRGLHFFEPFSESLKTLQLMKPDLFGKLNESTTAPTHHKADAQKWITVNGAAVPVDGEGNLQGKVGNNIMENGENISGNADVGTIDSPSPYGSNPDLPGFTPA